ncbi:MAG: PadR family transcriptional regulator [Thaumarchaeota archaeon]|nr:PadR family transcriptional regulator [Nitrososphaerota archaeon]
MNREALERTIVRILIGREISGYDAYKELSTKGVRLRSNYLYMILSDMRKRGLLKARWVENEKGPRKHLYSLSEGGQEEFKEQVWDSLNVLMSAFLHANLNTQATPDHLNAYQSSLAKFRIPPPKDGDKLVYTTPSFSPLACYPLNIRMLSDMLPKVSIFVVKPPGMRFYDDRPNVTFLDGRRHDIPLKDGFADHMVLEGFPRAASETKTILECARVMNEHGHLLIRVPSVMLEEKKPRFNDFAEFALKQYYDISEQDRMVSIARIKNLVEACFGKVMTDESRGNLVVYATERKRVREPSALQELPETMLPAR